MTVTILIVGLLLMLGVVLLMAEIFLLPGSFVAAVGGVVSFVGGIVYAFAHLGNMGGYIAIVVAVVLSAITMIYLVKSKAMDRIALKADVGSTVDQTEFLQVRIADEGLTSSRLNPRGKVNFGDLSVEVKSITGEFIDEHERVEVVRIENGSVFVKLIDED